MSWKGKSIFPNRRYFCMGFLAECKSGKTYLLGKILKKFLNANSIVHIFCPTFDTCKTWNDHKKWLDSSNLVYNVSDDVNEIAQLEDYIISGEELRDLEKQRDEEYEAENPTTEYNSDDDGEFMDAVLNRKRKNPKHKKPKRKIIPPEHHVIIDDCTTDVNNPAVISFIKRRRHCRARVYLLSQEVKDFKPGTISMCDMLLLFGFLPEERVLHARNCMGFARFKDEDMLGTYYKYTDKPYTYIMLCKEERCIRSSLTANIPEAEIKKLGYEQMIKAEKHKLMKKRIRKQLESEN